MRSKPKLILKLICVILFLSPFLVYGGWYLLADPTYTRFNEIALSSESFSIQSFANSTLNGYARQKTQLYSGVYSDVVDKTFIVYSAGKTGAYSECAPYIIAYDHSKAQWDPAVKLLASPVPPDAHYYPQLVIDQEGYLHVFHSFHANHAVMHAISQFPYSISAWNISYLNNSSRSTYGAAYTSQSGDIYFLSRDRLEYTPDYEPEVYWKSTDNGLTFQKSMLINPFPYNDSWGTIYTKSVKYCPDPEGLLITFGLHKEHNAYFDDHYYVFFDFDTNHLYSAAGVDLGTSVNRSEFEASCRIFAYGYDVPFFNTRMATILYHGQPLTYYNYETSNGTDLLVQAQWNPATTDWNLTFLPSLTDITPYEIRINATGGIELYALWHACEIKILFFDDSGYCGEKQIVWRDNPDNMGFGTLNFIKNAHPDMQGTFIISEYSNWREPRYWGQYCTFGISS